MNILNLLASKEVTGVNVFPQAGLDFDNIPRINYGHRDFAHLRKLVKSLSNERLITGIKIFPRFSRYMWNNSWTVTDGVEIESFRNIRIAKENGYLLELFPENGSLDALLNWLLGHCVKGRVDAIEGSWEVPYITLLGVKEHKNFLPAKEIIIPDMTIIQSSFVPARFRTKVNGLFERRQLLHIPFHEFVTKN